MKTKIEIPIVCPSCSAKLVRENDQLFCKNISCPAQLLAKIEHFAKALGIKGLGEKTVEKLDIGSIPELYYLTIEELQQAVGSSKVAEKLYSEIQRSKSSTLSDILVSFSIPLIGNTAAKKVCSVVGNIDEINEVTCKEAGLGEKATANLLNWLNTEFAEMRTFLPFNFDTNTNTNEVESEETVCITGKLKSYRTKAEATLELKERGFKVVDSVTKTTKYLVDEENKGSSKRKKAEEYNVLIINNLKEFLG